MDAVDRAILRQLQADARLTNVELAERVRLSPSPCLRRVRALERSGVIRGYHADVDPAALGLTIRAHIRFTLDGTAAPGAEKEVLKRLTSSPLVRSIHRVSGEDCFVAQVICRRIEDVTTLLAQVVATRALQQSRTAFVLEPVLDRAGLGPLDRALVFPPEGR